MSSSPSESCVACTREGRGPGGGGFCPCVRIRCCHAREHAACLSIKPLVAGGPALSCESLLVVSSDHFLLGTRDPRATYDPLSLFPACRLGQGLFPAPLSPSPSALPSVQVPRTSLTSGLLFLLLTCGRSASKRGALSLLLPPWGRSGTICVPQLTSCLLGGGAGSHSAACAASSSSTGA